MSDMSSLHELTEQIRGGEDLSRAQMARAIGTMMQGQAADREIGDFLLALRTKGETVDELAGAAQAMRQHMTRIEGPPHLVDTCGTGGDGSRTFNISTAAALVAASAGQPVAKHGNRSISSQSGSADLLSQLGVNIEASVEQVERCLRELGIGFCFAPRMHPSMKHVAAVRRQLGVPTVFNLLGPLCNPAGAAYQLVGVGRPALRPLLAAALQRLGAARAVVVHGEDGLDEVTVGGATRVSEVTGAQQQEHRWRPEQFGIQPVDVQALRVDGPEQSAQMVRGVLEGRPGPARDIVLVNAAVAMWTVRGGADPAEYLPQVAEAVDRGAASRLLARLVELTR